jgi:hypothetical protein
MSPNVKLATILVVALGSVGTTAAAFAQPAGLEVADENVHENTGPVSEQDVRFHEGLCQAGFSTEALDELGGCDILTAPGESDTP